MQSTSRHSSSPFRVRPAFLALSLLACAAMAMVFIRTRSEGCDTYVEADQSLVAHAGGGLPDRFYANDFEAMDLAVSNGFELIELDFLMVDGQLSIGHDKSRISAVSVDELRNWLARHPGVSIITDLKSGNRHLALLREKLGTQQIIPQIYHPSEFELARSLGFERIIFTAYRMDRDDWQDEVNGLDLFAVTIPEARRDLARGLTHTVYLHTVNEPVPGYGLYTQCLIPAS